MNRHQVLTGAVNAGDHCYAVGSVEGVSFTAYAAGCDIVILASNFERVQIIPGVCHGNIQIGCLDCSTDSGKIAAAYGYQVCIFEPTPLTRQTSTHKLDYSWVQTCDFKADCFVRNLSWNLEGTRLLTGGTCIQMWQYNNPRDNVDENEPESHIHFEISDGIKSKEKGIQWSCIWECKTAHPVAYLKFSQDGTLFASAGKLDRLVKIWYETKAVNFPAKSIDTQSSFCTDEVSFTFIYIAHPRAVTGLSWRKTSKYMPRGSVANMLVTSCKDNICRIWVQTVLPDDGLVNMQQFDPLAAQNPKYRTHRQKHKFMMRLKHIKTCFHFRRRQATHHQHNGQTNAPIPTLPSTFSSHDFHSFGVHGSGITPGFHFHLATSINAETDIPLVPSISASGDVQEPNFVLHWLNNKEMHFTLHAEQILQDLSKKALDQETQQTASEDNDVSEGVEVTADEEVDEGVAERSAKNDKKRLKQLKVLKAARFNKSKSTDEPDEIQPPANSSYSLSSTNSTFSLNVDPSMAATSPIGDALDRKIEALLRDWHGSPDLLFSIHPVDGSFLVWLVDWLDEYIPGSFRQAQVSFSSRIPNALPLGDAMTMSTNLALYNCQTYLDLKSVLKLGDLKSTCGKDFGAAPNTPVICMLSKHRNGSLNLWNITFNDNSKFTQVLSVGHISRVCGHRFRVNDISCHPVLPLLLTTSHHNVQRNVAVNSSNNHHVNEDEMHKSESIEDVMSVGFCSELILWRVDPVGPLCHSGGVTELARINSPEISAFSNVAWIPTLLPSMTLGTLSNSPSACFVASDGHSLRIYQAVIDARNLLAEIFTAERRLKRYNESASSLSSSSSYEMGSKRPMLQNAFKIVSQQSTARPGCIIQLDAFAEADHDWHNTQFLHVFQEQLITGEKNGDGIPVSGLMESTLDAMVDLQQSVAFEEPFYLVVLVKDANGDTILHMWRIIIASHPNPAENIKDVTYAPDSHLVQDSDHSNPPSRGNTPDPRTLEQNYQNASNPLSISSTKVCTQRLSLPPNVEIIHAAPAAGHLSSSSIYPACFAPYLITTACSDSKVRFWYCRYKKNGAASSAKFTWAEWEMLNTMDESSIDIPGVPLNVSCAYSGRFACAYKSGRSFTRPSSENPNSRFVNLCVAIYECESTGGSEWILEDTIHLKNISLPEIKLDLDLSYVYDKTLLEKKKQSFDTLVKSLSHEDMVISTQCDDYCYPNLKGLIAVPSFSTLQTLRKAISEKGNQCILTQKHLVQLDWVSTEDGSHVLTVGVGSKILLFTTVSSDLAQANIKAMSESKASSCPPVLTKASSMMVPHLNPEEIRWMKLRSVELASADGLPPLPMQISWVRDGILVVGMDNEMHVYCQWRDNALTDDTCVDQKLKDVKDFETSIDSRNLTDKDIINIAQDGAQVRMPPLAMADTKKKRELTSKGVPSDTSTAQTFMPDYGLFEASRMACPVLPQYHPKQLMELLNFGKIRRVKAILVHLVRCLSGAEARTAVRRSQSSVSSSKQRAWSRSRTLSISIPQGSSPMDTQTQSTILSEELHLDYVEINAIPPLPLYTLLAADKETIATTAKEAQTKDYGSLFASDTTFDDDDDIENILAEEEDSATPLDRRRSVSVERQGLTNFGTRQARTLTRLLTHTHLPGLSSLDQMHLLALADTVAFCNTAFADRFQIDAIKPDGTGISSSPESLDDCGLRFLLAMRHHLYLMRCLPPQQRIMLHKQGLNPATLVWAFHSESEEELVNVIPGMQKGVPKWSELKELGAGWWIRNNAVLKRCIEKVAKAAFQARSDPLDAALWYLSMRKKNLVWGLFRSVRDDKMTQFFQNNFAENRWRKAALKNAFILLGKQRFTHAAAFFLLAGSLWDAVEVCLNKLNDLQLAMVIVRMYEGDLDATPPGLKKLLYEEILGHEKDGSCEDASRAHPDPFLRSMAHWMLKDYNNALSTLLQTDDGSDYAKLSEEDSKLEDTGSRNAFNFYVYLRTHPLLIRQHIADSAQGKQTVLLTGFSGSSSNKTISIRNKQVFFEDAITPLERRLYFMTAHAHFKAGCPALALEVLSKLPSKVIDAFDHQSNMSNSPARSATPSSALHNISTGTIENGGDWSRNVPSKNQDTAFDWGQPTFNSSLNDEPFKVEFSDDENNDNIENDTEPSLEGSPNPPVVQDEPVKLDIMAQQLKFIACLKIVMEELSTLATGFEVDGGQLRYQLYIWLEREVEALKELCNYSGACPETRSKAAPAMSGTNPVETEKNYSAAASSKESSDKPTLHEILLADKMDFEAKLERAEKRKRWLKANETLLRTLLSYCSLHGASGGGLASVRMELILLLQELQQEKTQQQLLSPLPFPTTLPLLSASVACHKTVITDPIRHLQAMAHDILCCIIDLPSPGIPGCVSYPKVFVLRDLSTALSACIYQSLCDSDSFSVKHNGYLSAGMEALASTSVVYQESHLMAGCGKRRRLSSNDEPLQPTTAPNKWPGVTSLRALLAQEKDDDTPKLSVLLCEAFIAVYMSLLIQALSSAESHTLYRLMGQVFNEQTWSALFGGGVKKLLKVAVGSSSANSSASQSAATTETSHGEVGLLDTLVKQRMKLHMKILGQFGQGTQPPVIKEDRPTYREQFVPPEMSMASYFMTKPTLGNDCSNIDYDSNDSLPSEEELEDEASDDDDYLLLKERKSRLDEPCTEHSDPNSYSWSLMRYAVIRLAQHHVQKFLNIAGLELQEMPVASPLIHSILKIFDQWLNVLKDHMESYGAPPEDYIPTCFIETGTSGPAIQKYRSILESQNTPFKSRQNSVHPVRRLWCFLVHQEHVQDIFVRYIFGKKKILPLVDDGNSDETEGELLVADPIKIIHKDQDSISAFCINMANTGIIALATTKEVQELDISVLLEPPLWLEDNCEYDILNLNRSPESLPASEYLVVQTAADRPLLAQIAPSAVPGGQVPQYPPSSTVVNMPSTFTVQTGRSTTVLMKHKVDGVRRMNSHPVLPLYLTGCQDGSVRIWEWGHNQPVALPRAPGTYAKVTRVAFNPQGNKFGISDGDGNLSLWQVGLSSNANKMFFSHQCHGKQTSDFVFVGSSSLIATAGHSSESKNVCLWDTLLPQKKSMVQAFICHDQGCSCLVYAPQHQTIISGGKKGEIFILDVRQKQVRHRFSGHDSPIKCIALDPNEEFFVTGSADGDIKVWGLSYHNAFFTFQGEHMRNTFFRNISVGVSQLYVDTANRLFSCGADGSMKLRQLPERELAVHSIY